MKALITLIIGITSIVQGLAANMNKADSVHLGYSQGDGCIAFYNEVRVDESTDGTYFAVIGHRRGYMGLQEGGVYFRKNVIFSLWDPGSEMSPQQSRNLGRVEVVYRDPSVKVDRFGGEGVGIRTVMQCNWEKGVLYRFLIRVEVNGEETTYHGYFNDPKSKGWKYIAALRTKADGGALTNLYSFVEDFKGNGRKRRAAFYGNAWALMSGGDWVEITKAVFTCASVIEFANINAITSDNLFLLETGGTVARRISKNDVLHRNPRGESFIPLVDEVLKTK